MHLLWVFLRAEMARLRLASDAPPRRGWVAAVQPAAHIRTRCALGSRVQRLASDAVHSPMPGVVPGLVWFQVLRARLSRDLGLQQRHPVHFVWIPTCARTDFPPTHVSWRQKEKEETRRRSRRGIKDSAATSISIARRRLLKESVFIATSVAFTFISVHSTAAFFFLLGDCCDTKFLIGGKKTKNKKPLHNKPFIKGCTIMNSFRF